MWKKETDITSNWLMELETESIFCKMCDVKMNNINHHPQQKHLDHIIPFKMNGTHTKNNVRYVCRTCNLSRPKNGYDLVEFTHAI